MLQIKFQMILLRQFLCPLSPPPELRFLRSRSGQRKSTTTVSSSSRDAAAEKQSEEEEEYQIDPDKAREALRKLDEQLSSKQTNSSPPPPLPKIKAAAPYKEDDGDKFKMRIQPPLLNESFLSYTTFVLLAFTIFYNFLFATVIKPSIDFPDQPEQQQLEEPLSSSPSPSLNQNPPPLDDIDLIMPPPTS